MGRPRKFRTAEQLSEAWEKYKEHCDNQTVLAHSFSQKNSEYVSAELKHPITYTIEGFCVFIDIPRSVFYGTYSEDKRFSDTVTRIREECETDARSKFEKGVIDPKLAGLWMSNYGYGIKNETGGSSETAKSYGGISAELIIPTFAPVIFDIEDGAHSEYVFPGGRGSTKSSFISLEIIDLLMKHEDMHACILRQVGNTLRDTVYNQIL